MKVAIIGFLVLCVVLGILFVVTGGLEDTPTQTPGVVATPDASAQPAPASGNKNFNGL